MDMAAVDTWFPLNMHVYTYDETVAGNEPLEHNLTGIKITLYDRPMLKPAIEHSRGFIIRKIETWLNKGFVLPILRTEDGVVHKTRYTPPLKKRVIIIILEDKRNKSDNSEQLQYVATTVTTENRIRYHKRDEERG